LTLKSKLKHISKLLLFNICLIHSIVPKSQFSEYFFASPKDEDFVHCSVCKKKNHEICVLYYRLSGQPFYCQQCREIKNIEKIPMRAESIPKTECDIFIDKFLKAHDINKDSILTIRLLSDMENLLKVKKNIQEFRLGQDKIFFRNCTLFTFFDTGDGADICFFSVFFQLYGSNCDAPNRNTAYISYIDSVNLLPSSSRTKIYRMILLGLFEFLKTKGYIKIYLWSCPPTQNQDYIFYMKPPKMKMPTKERLSKWYVDLFKLGEELSVIESYVGVQEHSEAEKWEGISDIPYLDGDLWIARIDEAVSTVNREAKKLERETTNLRSKVDEARKKSNSETKKIKEMQGRLAKKITAMKENDKRATMWKMMNVQIRGFSSEYFVIHLSIPPGTTAEESEPNESIQRNWLNDRSALVDFLWEFMLEFSSERRAQFSTYVMLYRIFAESCICIGCSNISAAGLTVSCLNLTFSFIIIYFLSRERFFVNCATKKTLGRFHGVLKFRPNTSHSTSHRMLQ
jgi:E1A/CREB-binding protein